jgi:hypothetical protein
MVRQILGSVAQNDKSRLVLKLRVARTRKRAAQGFCEGLKPYRFLSAVEAGTLARMREPRRKEHRAAWLIPSRDSKIRESPLFYCHRSPVRNGGI